MGDHIEAEACCGGHGHAHEHTGEHAEAVSCASDGAVDLCGAGEGCCGGHGHASVDDLFAFPTTTEVVTLPAVQLAGLLDLVEKLAEDPAVLRDEVDYEQGQRLLAAQAPELVRLRDEFLERMKALLAEARA